jgi:hypothetical protein
MNTMLLLSMVKTFKIKMLTYNVLKILNFGVLNTIKLRLQRDNVGIDVQETVGATNSETASVLMDSKDKIVN